MWPCMPVLLRTTHVGYLSGYESSEALLSKCVLETFQKARKPIQATTGLQATPSCSYASRQDILG